MTSPSNKFYFAVLEPCIPYGRWHAYMAQPYLSGLHIQQMFDFTRDYYCCGTWVIGDIKCSPEEIKKAMDIFFNYADKYGHPWPCTAVGWTSEEYRSPGDYKEAGWQVGLEATGAYHNETIYQFGATWSRDDDDGETPDTSTMPWVLIPNTQASFKVNEVSIMDSLRRHAYDYVQLMRSSDARAVGAVCLSPESFKDHWGFFTCGLKGLIGIGEGYGTHQSWRIDTSDWSKMRATGPTYVEGFRADSDDNLDEDYS